MDILKYKPSTPALIERLHALEVPEATEAADEITSLLGTVAEYRDQCAALGAERDELAQQRGALLQRVVEFEGAHKRLQAEATKSERRAITFGDIVHQQVLAMRAAVVAAKLESLDVGMQWIANTLCGPGHLPDIEEARALGGAQALFDKEVAEHEAFRADHPAPRPKDTHDTRHQSSRVPNRSNTMLRFVIRRKLLDRNSGLQSEGLETLDVNCPELERVLRGGKARQEEYDHREVAGVEVLEACNQRIADQLKADAMTIFNGLETPQIVRDVIEWYDAALRTTP